jgi:uncharacterized protein (TIGR02145 family)
MRVNWNTWLYTSITIGILLIITNSCKKEEIKQIPVLTTSDVIEITKTTAISGGTITDDGGATIIERGVCWSTSTTPTISDSKTTAGTGIGSFTSNLNGLTIGTTYYLRAYATNGAGTGYGNTISFSTLEPILPTITTSEVIAITQTTAISGGTITDDGGATIIERGVCWSTNTRPTISDSKTSDGTGVGIFTSNLIDLSTGTTFHVRAYATNSVGTSYGSENIFSTTVIDIDGNIYHIVTIGTQLWMVENLKTTRYRDGNTIANITDNITWATQTEGAYCWYNNDIANKDTYGALYNWLAVMDNRNLCPEGWHIPSDTEWKTLEVFEGMTQAQADGTGLRGTDQGTRLKSNTGWNNNGNGTNTSGFSALPGGLRDSNTGDYVSAGDFGSWWSTSDNIYPWLRYMSCYDTRIYRGTYNKTEGYSVRCIKDL